MTAIIVFFSILSRVKTEVFEFVAWRVGFVQLIENCCFLAEIEVRIYCTPALKVLIAFPFTDLGSCYI